jgi:hypothetical protein
VKIIKILEKQTNMKDTMENKKVNEEIERDEALSKKYKTPKEMYASKTEPELFKSLGEQIWYNDVMFCYDSFSYFARCAAEELLLERGVTVEELVEFKNKVLAAADYDVLERIARYVLSEVPTREEMDSFLGGELVMDESILSKPELESIVYCPEANRWICNPEDDSAKLLTK